MGLLCSHKPSSLHGWVLAVQNFEENRVFWFLLFHITFQHVLYTAAAHQITLAFDESHHKLWHQHIAVAE